MSTPLLPEVVPEIGLSHLAAVNALARRVHWQPITTRRYVTNRPSPFPSREVSLGSYDCHPNCISVGSAVLSQLTYVPSTQTALHVPPLDSACRRCGPVSGRVVCVGVSRTGSRLCTWRHRSVNRRLLLYYWLTALTPPSPPTCVTYTLYQSSLVH